MATPVRIVKVGGSLLDMPDLPQRLRCWIDQQTTAHNVLIVGGGRMVEHLRQHRSARPHDETAEHWMCIEVMRLTASFLQDRLHEDLIDDFRLLQSRLTAPGCTLFSVLDWLRNHEPQLPGTLLPANWQVSSDAIAARLSVVLQADELVLLKSASPEHSNGCDMAAGMANLAASGYVDPMCEQLAAELPPWRMVNLRD